MRATREGSVCVSLKRIKGVFQGQIARITEVLEWGIETSLGAIAFSGLSGWENL